MSVSVNDVARELIDRLRLDPPTGAGNDKLHKLLYYLQGHHAAATGQPLFSEPIWAGDDGPVVEGFAGVDLGAPSRKWLWIIGGIVLATNLGGIGLFVLIGLGARNATDNPEKAMVRNAVAGQMGTPARDGKLEFTVTGMDCSNKTTGGMFPSRAGGTYCMVTLRVKNIDSQAQSFDESSQKAYDEKGTRYSNDAGAEFDAESGTHAWFKQLDPGSQVTGKLVFDVPVSTRLTSIELHDSPLSGGVKVPLN